MQPLALNPKVFEDNFLNYEENITKLVLFIERIEKFHQIYKDSKGMWIKELEEIRGKLGHNEKSMFDLLITKKLNKKYTDVDIDESNLIKALAQKTPDTLLISNNKIADVKNCYSQETFISDEFKPNNILYRIPKPVIVKPNYEFRNMDFIAPYIRNASKIEIMDKQLFKDARNDSEVNFLIDILKKVKKLREIQLYWEPNDLNARHKNFLNKLTEHFPEVNILPNKQYISRSENHDRFIIVNNNELSIRFNCSFNNFYINNNSYLSKAGFKIDYEKGRNFYS